MLVGLAALVPYELLAIRSASTEAKSALTETVAALTDGDTERAMTSLTDARRNVDEAVSRSHRPHLRLAATLPYLGADIEAIQAAASAAADITSAVEVATQHLADSQDPLYLQGKVDPDAAAEKAAIWEEAASLMESAVQRMETAPLPRLTAVTEASTEVSQRARQGQTATTALARLFDQIAEGAAGTDPFQVLFVFANGAELRAIGGVPVFLARVDIDQGQVNLGEVIPTPAAHPARPVEAPQDHKAVFGRYAAARLWSNLTLSADGPTVGLVASRMYEARTGVTPDMVIVADLVATGNLLAAFPDIEVDGAPFDASTLATEFLYDTYRRFPGNDQNQYLVETFTDVFAQAVATDPDPSVLLEAVAGALDGGRLVIWSSDSAIQEAITVFGAGHTLPPGEPGRVDVTVQNFGGTKLDLYTIVETETTLETIGCALSGRLDLTITESTPQPQREVLAYGAEENRWWVNIYLSDEATVQGLSEDGDRTGGDLTEWADRPLVSMLVDAPLGGATTATIEWLEPIPAAVTVARAATVRQPADETTSTIPKADGCRSPAR